MSSIMNEAPNDASMSRALLRNRAVAIVVLGSCSTLIAVSPALSKK
jgi:hypothetical protein